MKKQEYPTPSQDFLFHPLEISFCGDSGVGKTTLIAKLIKSLSQKYDIGYIKHDAHNFQMDREGKDTYKASDAGARAVFISNERQSALLETNLETNAVREAGYADEKLKLSMADCDVVFVEGYKKSLVRKILFLGEKDKQDATLTHYPNGKSGESGKNGNSGALQHVIAVVGSKVGQKKVVVGSREVDENIPFFHRDDLEGIEKFVSKTWEALMMKRKLYGLVLSGGKSTRMKTDKGALTYFDKSQVAHVYQLLSKYCEASFVSCTKKQSGEQHLKPFPQIHDRFLDFGPAGGILSAMHRYDDVAWLVVACDLPYLQQSTLEKLVLGRNPYKAATCFFNSQRNWPEPLCAIYEPKALLKLATNLALKKPCPRKMLSGSNIHLLSLDFEKHLENVNTPEERELAKKELAEKELAPKHLEKM